MVCQGSESSDYWTFKVEKLDQWRQRQMPEPLGGYGGMLHQTI